MKKKWIKYIKIFLCIFVIGITALYGAWRVWFDPYRGTVSTFGQSKRLDTVLTGKQAAEDLEYIVNRLKERHPACISDLPAPVRKAYEQEHTKLSESAEVTVLSLWQSASRFLHVLMMPIPWYGRTMRIQSFYRYYFHGKGNAWFVQAADMTDILLIR